MTRPYHYLRPSRHVGFPRHQMALAITWERRPRQSEQLMADDVLTGWGACEWSGCPGHEKWQAAGEGRDAESWWRWLAGRMRRRQQIWLWGLGMAHALTMLGFWPLLDTGQWALGEDAPLCIIEDPPTIILARPSHATGSVRWLDARNLGHEGPFATVRDLATWLWAWSRTVDELKLGGLRHTAAAQSWHGWRYSYLECGVLVHGNSSASELERDSIHPGRAEAYRLGVVPGPVWHVDARSHYPSCAVSGALPCRLKWCGSCDWRQLRGAIGAGWLSIARCRVRCRVPLLPCKHRVGTVWPVGEWTVTLPGPEIERARASGCLVSVTSAALYEPGMPCERYMYALWGERCRATARPDATAARCIKLLMNSWVGKLAARQRQWVSAPEALAPDSWHTWHRIEGDPPKPVRYRSIGWHAQRLEIGPETAESTPALASWIYSVGRMRLWDWCEQADREDVYNVDSDSLFLGLDGYTRLVDSGGLRPIGLGALRLQGVYPSIRIGGIRDYSAGGRKVQAGTPKAGTEESGGYYRWWRSSTVRESVDEGHQPDATARLVVVPVHRAYRHGVVDGTGHITPLVVYE